MEEKLIKNLYKRGNSATITLPKKFLTDMEIDNKISITYDYNTKEITIKKII